MGSQQLSTTSHHVLLCLPCHDGHSYGCSPAGPIRSWEIPAEPYIHQEIAAEPYVHQEPPLSPEALGNVAYAAPAVPTGYAAGPIWSGACINNLGQSVPCRQ